MNKIYIALLAFVITFCTPWAIASALDTYAKTGSMISQFIYEAINGE